jgi:hypothetical protein
MKIDPSVWSASRVYAKNFIQEYYLEELQLFNALSEMIEKRMIALNWSFDLSSAHLLTSLGFAAGTLDTASVLISLAIPILLSKLPCTPKPSPDKINTTVAEVMQLCGTTAYFANQFKKLAHTIYSSPWLPDSASEFIVGHDVYQITTNRECIQVPIEEGIALYKQALADKEIDIVIDYGDYQPVCFVRKQSGGGLISVKITRPQARFMMLLIQKRAPIKYDELAQGVLGINDEIYKKDKNDIVMRIQKIKSRICDAIYDWVGERIKSPEKEVYMIDPDVKYFCRQRKFQTKANC